MVSSWQQNRLKIGESTGRHRSRKPAVGIVGSLILMVLAAVGVGAANHIGEEVVEKGTVATKRALAVSIESDRKILHQNLGPWLIPGSKPPIKAEECESELPALVRKTKNAIPVNLIHRITITANVADGIVLHSATPHVVSDEPLTADMQQVACPEGGGIDLRYVIMDLALPDSTRYSARMPDEISRTSNQYPDLAISLQNGESTEFFILDGDSRRVNHLVRWDVEMTYTRGGRIVTENVNDSNSLPNIISYFWCAGPTWISNGLGWTAAAKDDSRCRPTEERS